MSLGDDLGDAVLAALDGYIASLLDGDGNLTAPINRQTAERAKANALWDFFDANFAGSGGYAPPIPQSDVADLPGDLAALAADTADVAADLVTHAADTTTHGISGFGATLVDDADATAARATLGLGTAATQASGAFDAAGAAAAVGATAAANLATHEADTTTHGISAFGATLVDAADAATARATLGLASVASSGSASDLGAGTLPIARIADGAVTSAKLRNSAALSVIGRTFSSVGPPADIATTLDSGHVLVAAGGSLLFDTVNTNGIADGAVTNAKAADMANATIKARITAGTGDPEDATATQIRALLGGHLLGIQFLTAGNYLPTAGTTRILVEGVGGGGAGGSVAGGGGGAAAGGGQAGAFGARFYTGIGAGPYACTYGAAGAAAAAGANNGGDGGATTFSDGTTVLTCPGGSGGAGCAGGITNAAGGSAGAGPTNSNAGGHAGAPGGRGYTVVTTLPSMAGIGGSSPFGVGGAQPYNAGGAAGSGYGAGGSGAATVNASSRVGGAGTAGAIRIWEFS